MTGTAALGGARAGAQVIVLNYVSATSMSTLNTFMQAINILLGILIQHTPVTPFLVVGVALVIVFALLYGVLKTNKPILDAVDSVTDGCLKRAPGTPAGEAVGDGPYAKA